MFTSFPFAFWRQSGNGAAGFGINYGYEFDGVDESINFGNVLDISKNDTFSFSFWIKRFDTGAFGIMGKSNGGGLPGWSFDTNGAGTYLNFYYENTSSDRLYSVVTAPTLNAWQHYVLTFDGSGDSNGFTWYIDGVQQTPYLIGPSSMTGDGTNSADFEIGTGTKYAGGSGNNRLDDIQFYNFELNSTQVSDIYNSGYVTAPTASPIHHWKLGEEDTFSTNWTVKDSVGSLDGTSVNMEEADRKLGVAYSMNFDGVDEYIDFGNVNDLTGFEPFSISFWTTAYNGAGNGQIINKHDGSKGYYLYMNSSNNPHFIMQDGTNTIFVFSSLANGVGHHVLTYDGSGLWTGIKYYINGVSNTVTLVASNSSISSSISNTSNFYFGSPTTPINGDFMYLSMYNTELSASDVTSLYNSGVPVDPRDVSLNPSFFALLGGPNDTFSTNWAIVDEINGNNGTSVNMEEADKTSETP